MRSAALKAGIKTPSTPVYYRSLTQLRKSQRPDKTKSVRKAPRRFDLLPVHELNDPAQVEEIQLAVASNLPAFPRSSVDDVIEQVVNQAYNEEEIDYDVRDDESTRLWCHCRQPSFGEMVACDAPKCSTEWFHFSCVNIIQAPESDWYCGACKPKSSKRKLQFDKNVTKANKKSKREKCSGCNSVLSISYLKTHMKKYCTGMI